jgi:VCBS repeat-containing protein
VLTNDTDPDSVGNGEARTVSALRTGTEAGSGTAGALVGAALAGTFGSLTLNADGSYTYVDRRDQYQRCRRLRVTGQQTHRRVHLHDAGRRRPVRHWRN